MRGGSNSILLAGNLDVTIVKQPSVATEVLAVNIDFIRLHIIRGVQKDAI